METTESRAPLCPTDGADLEQLFGWWMHLHPVALARGYTVSGSGEGLGWKLAQQIPVPSSLSVTTSMPSAQPHAGWAGSASLLEAPESLGRPEQFLPELVVGFACLNRKCWPGWVISAPSRVNGESWTTRCGLSLPSYSPLWRTNVRAPISRQGNKKEIRPDATFLAVGHEVKPT